MNMLKSISTKLLTVLFISALITACQEAKKKQINFPPSDLAQENLIPMPLKVVPTHKAFGLDRYTAIYTSPNTKGFTEIGRFLSDKIKSRLDLNIPVNENGTEPIERIIYINQSDSLKLDSPEAYQLYITQDSVIINSNT